MATTTSQLSDSRQLDERELRAWRGMLRAHAALTKALDADLDAAHGLPLSSYEVLLYLNDAAERRMRMRDLAASVILSRSGLTRLADRLEREGLIRRESCSERRARRLRRPHPGRRRDARRRPHHAPRRRALALPAALLRRRARRPRRRLGSRRARLGLRARARLRLTRLAACRSRRAARGSYRNSGLGSALSHPLMPEAHASASVASLPGELDPDAAREQDADGGRNLGLGAQRGPERLGRCARTDAQHAVRGRIGMHARDVDRAHGACRYLSCVIRRSKGASGVR